MGLISHSEDADPPSAKAQRRRHALFLSSIRMCIRQILAITHGERQRVSFRVITIFIPQR
jgi:hypothetical protein